MARFEDKRALVTGAASGIGRATARLLADEGASLIVVDPAPVDLGGEHRVVTGSVADEGLWAELSPALEGLDLAVVNAGIAGGGPIAQLELAEWRRVLDINLDGAFLTLRAAMRAMAGRAGSIVLVGSAAGIKAEPGTAPYGASKAAVLHLAKIAAREGAAQRLRVNAIAPGGVATPIWRSVPMLAAMMEVEGEDAVIGKMAAATTPLGRYAQAEEIARQIAFLLSDDAATITGTVLLADGGYTL